MIQYNTRSNIMKGIKFAKGLFTKVFTVVKVLRGYCPFGTAQPTKLDCPCIVYMKSSYGGEYCLYDNCYILMTFSS